MAAPMLVIAERQQGIRQPSESQRGSDATATSDNLFVELAGEVAAGRSFIVNFQRTEMDTKAEAVAQVVLRGQTLLVRMRAHKLPLPSHFEVPRYALWVYLPNYQVKMYIGDLPVTLNSKPNQDDITKRGEADTAYRFSNLPPGAVFGGLLLTAEPARYTPVINQSLRPVLVGFTSELSIENTGATVPAEELSVAPR